MTRLTTALLAIAVAIGCNFDVSIGDSNAVLTDPGPEKERLESLDFAERFLVLLDEGGETYIHASPFLQSTTPELVWSTTLSGLRSWVGEFESRTASVYGYTEELPDAPRGHYFVIEYNSRFTNGNAAEKVVVSVEDERYTVAGYHLTRTWSSSTD